MARGKQGPETGRSVSNGYATVYVGRGKRHRREHRVIAERVLGKPLPRGVEVHHVNGDRMDNRHCNLVICENHAYHSLLEVRSRALVACGNANWRKCDVCLTYDSPDVLRQFVRPNGYVAFRHRGCKSTVKRASSTP